MKLRRCFGFISFALMATPAVFAHTLCVSAKRDPGCYTKIQAAVLDSVAGDIINVGPGTYAESISITHPLSLVGNAAIIDATGEGNGIIVNGLATHGLANVHLSGFTVKNADLEGILVLNASDVTISTSYVTGNNRALIHGVCTKLPAYETLEISDCGEGIHLQAVNHSIVSNNVVQNNSGGILLTDDTGPTHDNLISFNTVSDNAYACGLVLASHPPAPVSGSMVPFGVFRNTVYGNRSQRNGLLNGGGAGAGVFASVPGAKAYGNVIVDNLLSDNGLPGVAMHAHAPGQDMTDNMIVGNTIVSNGPDTEDASTPGTAGINVYSLVPQAGNIISGNTIQGESYDVVVNEPALVQVHFNALQSSGSGTGVENLGAGAVDATVNWWSCPNGPGISPGCTLAEGAQVQASPGLSSPIPSQPNY